MLHRLAAHGAYSSCSCHCLLPARRYQTAQPGNKIGLEMDDGGARPGDIFDVDGTDDDAEARARPG